MSAKEFFYYYFRNQKADIFVITLEKELEIVCTLMEQYKKYKDEEETEDLRYNVRYRDCIDEDLS